MFSLSSFFFFGKKIKMRVIAIFAIIVIATMAVNLVAAVSGGDVSSLYSVGAYKCFKNEGNEFIIVRGYCSYGGVDPNGRANIDNAHAAGIKYHDIYHFPCIGKSAKEQVQETYNAFKGYLDGGGSMLWFDIETNPSPGCGYRSQSENCNFLKDLIDAANSLGIHNGVYTSPGEWSSTMGGACHAGADAGKQLWWADYNGQQGFAGYYSFGGWAKPAIHQWADNGASCGMSYDKNYYP